MFGEDRLGQFKHFPCQLEVGRILFLLLFLGFFVSVVLGIAGSSLVGADRLVVFDSFSTFLRLFGAWTSLSIIAFFLVLRLLFVFFFIILFAVFFGFFCKKKISEN